MGTKKAAFVLRKSVNIEKKKQKIPKRDIQKVGLLSARKKQRLKIFHHNTTERLVSRAEVLDKTDETFLSKVLIRAKNDLMSSNEDKMKLPFSEFTSSLFWTARVTFSMDKISEIKKTILECTEELSREIAMKYIFFGYFTPDRSDPTYCHYNITNFARAEVYLPSMEKQIEQNRKILAYLQSKLRNKNISNITSIIEGSYEDRHGKDCRVLLGLVEGDMRNIGENMVVHNKKEIVEALAWLTDSVDIIDAYIFSAGKNVFYEERAHIIYAKSFTIPYIYLLAFAFRQEEFTVEYFSNLEPYSCIVHVREFLKERLKPTLPIHIT